MYIQTDSLEGSTDAASVYFSACDTIYMFIPLQQGRRHEMGWNNHLTTKNSTSKIRHIMTWKAEKEHFHSVIVNFDLYLRPVFCVRWSTSTEQAASSSAAV